MFTEKNEIIEQYINFLSDKGKITGIKDENKNLAIKFSNGFTGYFLVVASILFTTLTAYLVLGKDTFVSGYDPVSKFIIITGFALFSIILIFVTKNEVSKIKLIVTYLNDSEMKINNKIYNIQKEDCYIDIVRKFETRYDYRTNRLGSGKQVIMYYLTITKNNKKKSFIITPEIEEMLGDFILNFEYEKSDWKKQKQEMLDELSSQYINLKKQKKEGY